MYKFATRGRGRGRGRGEEEEEEEEEDSVDDTVQFQDPIRMFSPSIWPQIGRTFYTFTCCILLGCAAPL